MIKAMQRITQFRLQSTAFRYIHTRLSGSRPRPTSSSSSSSHRLALLTFKFKVHYFLPVQLYPYYFYLHPSAGIRSATTTSKRKRAPTLPGKFCFLPFDSLSFTFPFLASPVDSGSESESGEHLQLNGTSF